MASVPENLKYSAEHEWVDGELVVGGQVTVGITEHAADALGDIVYVEAPTVGSVVTAGAVCGELESTKAVVRELYSPVTGTVSRVNDALGHRPRRTSTADPFRSGWIFKVDLSEAPGGAARCRRLRRASRPKP